MRRRHFLGAAGGLAIAGCASIAPKPSSLAESSSAPSPSPTASVSTPPNTSVTATAAATPSASAESSASATGLLAGTNHNVAAKAYAYPAQSVQSWLRQGAKAPDYPTEKIAFLTIDDGPSANRTSDVLDLLKQLGVPATYFYIVGPLGVQHVDRAIPLRALAEGHALAIHTWSHSYKVLYPGRVGNVANITADYDKAYQAMRDLLGPEYVTHASRYPGGHMSWKNLAPADAALEQRGLYWIDWNTEIGDGELKAPPNGPAAVTFFANTLKAAANPNVVVVLMHDAEGAHLINGALPGVVKILKDAGYKFGVIA